MENKETVENLIDNFFKDENIKWFDYTDYIKASYDSQRKGLKYLKNFSRFELFIVSEEGEEILFDVLQNDDILKFQNIIKAFWQ